MKNQASNVFEEEKAPRVNPIEVLNGLIEKLENSEQELNTTKKGIEEMENEETKKEMMIISTE